MKLLKQSTGVTCKVGPFLDKTDGVTEETGLAGGGTELSVNGGAFAAGPTLGTHDAEGWYPVTFTTTHTTTLGSLKLKSHAAATHLPVWDEWTVVPANVYDSLVGGSDTLTVDLTQIGGNATNATNLGTAASNYSATRGLSGTALPAAAADAAGGLPISDAGGLDVDALNTNVSAILTDTGTSIPALLPAALINGRLDVDVQAVSGNTTAATNLQSMYDGTGYVGGAIRLNVDLLEIAGNATNATNLGTAASNYSATRGLSGTALPAAAADAAGGLPISDAGALDLDTMNSNVSAILTDTGTTLPATLGTPAGASMSVDIAAVKTDTAAILVDTGTTIPATLGTPAGADLATDIAANQTDLDTIIAAITGTLSEATAVPAANASMQAKLNFIASWARNKLTQTATTMTLYRDDGTTALATSTVSDDATTFTRGELA